MAGDGPDRISPGAEVIIKAVDRPTRARSGCSAWGGTNTLAQALFHARRTRKPAELGAFIAKLRVYAISDQDDAGPWLRRDFQNLHYIAMPSTQDGEEYYLATWTGISGDRFYRNAPGADFTTFTDAWVKANIRSQGPLGALYSTLLHPRGRHAVVPRPDRQRPRQRDEPDLSAAGADATCGGSRPASRGRSGRRAAIPIRGATARATPSRRRRPDCTPPTRRRSGAGAPPSSTTSRRAWRGRSGRAARTTTRGSS